MNSHKPIVISHLSISFLHKICFEDFNETIYFGDHIVLIGDNGSGKSTLLSLLARQDVLHEGTITCPLDIVIGYLPQNLHLDQHKTVWEVATAGVVHIMQDLQRFELLAQQMGQSDKNSDEYDNLLEKLIASDAFSIENKIISLLQQMGLVSKKDDHVSTLSGGQQVLLGLVKIISMQPDVLLLDEPTNHLDGFNREKLFEFLRSWQGTAIIVSHDMQLLHTWPKKIWEIAHGEISVFNGIYVDYLRKREIAEKQQMQSVELLQREKKKLIKAQEEERARQVQSKKMGEKKYANAPKVVRNVKKEQAAHTAGKKHHEIVSKQEEIARQLQEIHEHKIIVPTFVLSGQKQYGTIAVHEGAIGYGDHIIVHDINLLVKPGERVAFVGDNGSGKSTIFKAILDENIRKNGTWQIPAQKNIGYLNQKYTVLEKADTPFLLIKKVQTEWSNNEIRSLLNDFLFSKNEEVNASIATLSGGEKARLSLAYIAAQSPSLLLLDEVTNNVDLTTRNHIVSVLNQFPGTLLVISHDTDFLRAIRVERIFTVSNGVIVESML